MRRSLSRSSIFAYWGYSTEQLKRTAIDGTLNVLDAAQRVGVRRVVLTSSSVVAGSSVGREVLDETGEICEKNPPPYLIAKAEQERAASRRGSDLGIKLVTVCQTMSIGAHDYRLSPSNAIICSYLNDPFKVTLPGGCNLVSVRATWRAATSSQRCADSPVGAICSARRISNGQRSIV
jgi:dihydroflavonol-4-reductase